MSSVNEWLQTVFNALSLSKPPLALLFLFCFSLSISLLIGYCLKKMHESTEEKYVGNQILLYKSEKKQAITEQKAQLWIKVLYNEPRLQELERSIIFQKIMPQLIIALIYIFIFTFLREIIGDPILNATPETGGIVAILPFEFPSQVPIFGMWFSTTVNNPTLTAAGFGTMYLVAAISSSIFVRSFFGLNTNPNATSQSTLSV